MLSRVAEALYWMSRYIERAENNARILTVNQQLVLDFAGAPGSASMEPWEPIIYALADKELFYELYSKADEKSVVEFVMFDKRNPNSVYSCLSFARENARTVREQITSEMWEQINTMYLSLGAESTRRAMKTNTYGTLKLVLEASQLFQGITISTMSHGEDYEFIGLGRFFDRADRTSRMLDVKYHTLLPSGETIGGNVDTIQWMAVLKSASALEPFRKQHVGQVTPANVANYLIRSKSFPRAIQFCVNFIDQSLHRISGSEKGTFANEAERLAGRLRASIAYNTMDDIFAIGMHEYLDQIQLRLIEISKSLSKSYFERS